MRYRVFPNPIWTFESDKLSHHRGEVLQHVAGPACFDRSIQGRAKSNSTTDVNNATGYKAGAEQIASSIIPGLEREAQTPQGFTPEQKNRQLVASQEGVGGASSGITGTADLTAARTRNAGGFARALDEAQRQRGRQLSSNEVGIQSESDKLGLARQAQAQQMLSGLYGTDTSAALKSMGMSDEALNTALQAGKSGWYQNTLAGIEALKPKIGGGEAPGLGG